MPRRSILLKVLLILIFLYLLYNQFFVCISKIYIPVSNVKRSSSLSENEKDRFDEKTLFYRFIPPRMLINKSFVNRSHSLNDSNIQNLKTFTSNIVNFNCKNNAETVIFVLSDPNNFLLRQDIRNSYGKNNVKFKYMFENGEKQNISHCFLFSIGYREDIDINNNVDFEAFIYKDIIRIPTYEEYRNIVNKVIITLYLLDKMEIPFKFVLKTDDDIFLMINKIIPLIHNLKNESVFVGHVINGAIPIRNSNHKWYVSKEEYPNDFYESYLQGSCYIIRRSILNTVIKRHETVPLISIEDIYISSLVTGSGFEVTDSIFFTYCNYLDDCENSYIIDLGRHLVERNFIINDLKLKSTISTYS
ncbi:hypothetical protein MXB_2961 [Myxobolus squamalis]|nr:hypothetical protein MXB_2961 [Myxobolus squamalis]